jgi:hypothetical protein
VVGARDFLKIGVGELAVDAVNQRAHFSGVNKESFAFAGADAPFSS